MDVFYVYTYGTAAWLSVQAIPLLVVPKLILSLLAPDGHHSTDVELYLSRSLAFSLLLLAIITLFFTGTIPLYSSASSTTTTVPPTSTDPKSPYATPLIFTTTLYHSSTAIYAYARYTALVSAIGPSPHTTTGYVLGGIGSGAIASLGLWCLMFGTGRGHVSKRTGADKRTTGFPFKNAAAYDKKKDRKMG